MQARNQSGFSILELMVVFALISMLGAFVVPNFFRQQQGVERKEFLNKFEMLVKDAVLLSVIKNKVHQIYYNVTNEVVQIRVHDATSIEANEHKKFAKVDDQDYLTEIKFLKNFKIINFFIDGLDGVASGSTLIDVMFYIMPDGTSQPVVANIIDQSDDVAQDVKFSFVINPFYARIFVYDRFQTP